MTQLMVVDCTAVEFFGLQATGLEIGAEYAFCLSNQREDLSYSLKC